jgi:hypothetical protein
MKSAGLGIVSNRLIGVDGARPEVGWVPVALHAVARRLQSPGFV